MKELINDPMGLPWEDPSFSIVTPSESILWGPLGQTVIRGLCTNIPRISSPIVDSPLPGAKPRHPWVNIPRRISPHLIQGRNRIFLNRLRFDCQQGVGLDGGVQGSNPYLYLRISRDGGNTYGPERIAPLGAIGQYAQVTHFDRLGYARDFVLDVYGGDPVPYRIAAAYADMFEGAS